VHFDVHVMASSVWNLLRWSQFWKSKLASKLNEMLEHEDKTKL